MTTPMVSILVPHYQTPQLTSLCLRLLRRNTRRGDYEVVAIDNGSTDHSDHVLRGMSWVRVLRRQPDSDERVAQSHGRALNLGVEATSSPFVLVMHTDTMVLRPDWLHFLLNEMNAAGPTCGVVGSWKMESSSRLRRFGKWLESSARRIRGKLRPERRYPRSHCALYRRAALNCWPQMFDPGPAGAAGESLHIAMESEGWTTRLLLPETLGRYVRHLNHATMALNEHLGSADRYMPRTRARSIRRIRNFFSSIHADEILADATLTQ